MPEEFDLIVIGAGSAARDGAMKARASTARASRIVERTRWGGSCPNVACRPTKAYLVAAELLHDINSWPASSGSRSARRESTSPGSRRGRTRC